MEDRSRTRKRFPRLVLNVVLWTCALFPLPLFGQDISQIDLTRLGDELTIDNIEGANTIQVTAPNVTDNDLRIRQLEGFATFHSTTLPGVGPFFVHVACGSCHRGNGRGKVRIPRNKKRSHPMIVKISLNQGLNELGFPIDLPAPDNEQLKPRSTTRKTSRHKISLRWTERGFKNVPGYKKLRVKYPDNGKVVKLRRPLLRFRVNGVSRKALATSLRMTPPIIGPGLLEAIPEDTILGFSDPEDTDNDGISGIPNYVPDLTLSSDEQVVFGLGRFGLRAGNTSTANQSAAAAFHDMGVTTSTINPTEDAPELSDEEFEKLVIYQMLAGVPDARDQDDPVVQNGKILFQQVGCDDCHKFNITTNHAVYEELSGQTIHPFTDLLLHDMGPGLADKRAEFSASGSEFKTAPLWGIGHKVSNIVQKYLHDGRARSIEEAVLWHGGEGSNSRDAFINLPEDDRSALLRFISSL